jgi:apolipoprotein N-acyltransferase
VTGARALDRASLALGALAPRLDALRGWRRVLLALLLGVALAATLPPVHALPLFPIAVSGLLWLTARARTPASAFATGFWFGWGFFLAGLYWIGFALMTDPERFGWLVAPAVLGISGGLALFFAIAALLLRLLRLDGPWSLFAFSALWGAHEWLRGHVLTGFPWNLAGSAFSLSDAMNQFAALLGGYGSSLVLVFAGGLPALLASSSTLQRRLAVPAMFALLFAIWLGGTVRLALAPEIGTDATALQLRIVQPNIAQSEKWRPEQKSAIVARHLALTARPSALPLDLVIWPEAATPFVLDEDPAVPRYLAEALPPAARLITGAPRRSPPDATPAAWNSVYAIDAEGRLIARYDKHHLVPFGEYVPLRKLLGLSKIVPGALDFSEGPGPRTVAITGVPPFSPLVCYEAIFPDGVIEPGGSRPAWLLNLTNDGWFGITSGPFQHLASARLRAVEQGLPLVRAANTGISAVVDAYGREIARLPLGDAGVIDRALPAALEAPPVYARIGDAPFFAIIILVLSATCHRWMKRRRDTT